MAVVTLLVVMVREEAEGRAPTRAAGAPPVCSVSACARALPAATPILGVNK